MNTKYISSSGVKYYNTSENANIFSSQDEIYLVLTEKGEFYSPRWVTESRSWASLSSNVLHSVKYCDYLIVVCSMLHFF